MFPTLTKLLYTIVYVVYPILWISYFMDIICVASVTTNGCSGMFHGTDQGLQCQYCSAGTFLYGPCTVPNGISDCRPCPFFHYQPGCNVAKSCAPCNDCKKHRADVDELCTPTAQTRCICAEGQYYHNETDIEGVCVTHSTCPPNQGVVSKGTRWKNTVCHNCPPGTDSPDDSLEPCKPTLTTAESPTTNAEIQIYETTNGTLTDGQIIAIVFCVFAFVFAVIVCTVVLYRRKMCCFERCGAQRKYTPPPSGTNFLDMNGTRGEDIQMQTINERSENSEQREEPALPNHTSVEASTQPMCIPNGVPNLVSNDMMENQDSPNNENQMSHSLVTRNNQRSSEAGTDRHQGAPNNERQMTPPLVTRNNQRSSEAGTGRHQGAPNNERQMTPSLATGNNRTSSEAGKYIGAAANFLAENMKYHDIVQMLRNCKDVVHERLDVWIDDMSLDRGAEMTIGIKYNLLMKYFDANPDTFYIDTLAAMSKCGFNRMRSKFKGWYNPYVGPPADCVREGSGEVRCELPSPVYESTMDHSTGQELETSTDPSQITKISISEESSNSDLQTPSGSAQTNTELPTTEQMHAQDTKAVFLSVPEPATDHRGVQVVPGDETSSDFHGIRTNTTALPQLMENLKDDLPSIPDTEL